MIWFNYCNTSQPGPSAAKDKNFLWVPIGTFYVAESFSPVIHLLRFWSLGYSRVRGSDCQGHSCGKNLTGVGGKICGKFGGD